MSAVAGALKVSRSNRSETMAVGDGDGVDRIFGVIVESHLLEGHQDLKGPRNLFYRSEHHQRLLGMGRQHTFSGHAGGRRPFTAQFPLIYGAFLAPDQARSGSSTYCHRAP